ncbi:similar to Saccharomyces cerevisiae YMR001C CDC5 Polo-like kinase with multiple functions in mitosis and cytokinesis through substrate phosphorylation [Maudiozyma saulgeensis]|uniref:Serine/threonine-protein kinase n=1 Tax=Maudiozyma saulgeensis TaxID=1789683 RepID=A0A1X7RBF8_9SACH|nr:similar to Saccharomyces cerevisiae YMR001C CDC5 Polo-like kinase with multiple functions in mitosis and cytokinesis through substrate phosphorylation [Kazachstania saulgeensis]
MSLAPLQTVNEKQLNSRAIHTPIKKNNLISENKENFHNSNNKRLENGFNQKQPPQKKKKEKLSSLCKTPPSLIKTRGKNYHRGHSLGEGGFARCFQMKDDAGKIYAAKTVAKISIKSEKTRKKLLSEIQIHKSMKHTNIVQFIDCFEDDVNVYILLEICPNGSLMDLLKKRKLLTEPEVRFFTTQICGAIKYMHSRRVIHRDLKLGNIFFDKDFNVKVGDFGLAATLGNDRERKYTICGTPNYIAPEVLMGKHSGHSYEVDIWSVGVMIYALLIGKPPFQSKDVNTIYERIKCRDFSFPAEKPISSEAKLLIQDILSVDPLERPSIKEIMDYLWFRGCFPPFTRDDVMTTIPCYEDEIGENASIVNFRYCMDTVGLLDYTSYNQKKQSIPLINNGNNNNNNAIEEEMNKYHSITTVLPQSLSPGGTRNKYKEVIDIESQRKFNELARQSRLRRAQQESIKKNLVPTSTNTIKSEISLRILASECHLTLNGILEAEAQKKMGGLAQSRLPKVKHPMIVTKWVDYSNKHGFSYQLSTEDIGVLFNNGCTVLRLADAEEFWYISYDNKEGWIASHYLLNERPKELNRYLEVVDFFATYMRANLSRVSTFGREEYHKDDVFLRRYTRFKPFVMFELSDGTFQFNFKDHHKLAVSEGGKLVTYISPSHESFTYPLVEVLKTGNIPNYPECKFMEKLTMIKEGLKQKSAIVRVEQTEV